MPMPNTETYVTTTQLLLVIGVPSAIGTVLMLYSFYRLRQRGKKLGEAEGLTAGQQVFRSLVDPDPPYRVLQISELTPNLCVNLEGTGPSMTVWVRKIESAQVTFEESFKKITLILARDGETLRDQHGNEIKISGRAPYFGNIEAIKKA